MNRLEERTEYKRLRRTRSLRKLVDRLQLRILAGKESQRQIEMILERISQQGYYPAIIDAIRNKN